MPLYIYKCDHDHETQVNCTIKDRQDVVECIECRAEAKMIIRGAGLIAGKTKRHRTKRQEMDTRLAEREQRLQNWENSTPDDKKKAEQFRRLSRKLTNGKF